MKSAWTGSGRSHQSVPSLSKTATRSSGGTKPGPLACVTLSTKRVIARRVAVSDQDGSGLSLVPMSLLLTGCQCRTGNWSRLAFACGMEGVWQHRDGG